MVEALCIEGKWGPIGVHVWRPESIGDPNQPTYLALHGFTGDGLDFEPVARADAQESAWIAIDMPGHGRSYCGDERTHYGLKACIENLNTVICHFDVSRYRLLGYSMGGRVAMHYALEALNELSALVLVGASPGLSDAAERAARVREDEQLAQSIVERGVSAFLKDWYEKPIIVSQTRIPFEMREPVMIRRRQNSALGLANSLRGIGTGALDSLWGRLGEFRMPVWLVTGETDDKFRKIAEAMVPRMPRTENVVLSGAGHAVHLEASEALSGVLVDRVDA